MSIEFIPLSTTPHYHSRANSLTVDAPVRATSESDRPHVIYLGLGYLLALAAIGGLAERLAPDLGPFLYSALLLLLLLHAALSWKQPFRCLLPLLLALAPVARLVLSALGSTHPAARTLALSLPTLAALTAAAQGLLGLQLPRLRLPQPLPEADRPHVIYLGLGYLLALAAIGGLAERLAPDLGPFLYSALLLLLLFHAALSWKQPFRCLPLLLALAPVARLVLSALGATHPAARTLALSLPTLAALTAAAQGLLGLQLPRLRLPQPLPEADRPHVIYLGLGYLLALAAIGGLAERLAPDLGPFLYSALLLLLLLHVALSWKQPFRCLLPLLLALAPVARLVLSALGPAHPAARTLALSLPTLAAAAAALGFLGLRITLPSLSSSVRLQSVLYRQICNQRDLVLLFCILLHMRVILCLQGLQGARLNLLASRCWTVLCQKLCEQRVVLQRLSPIPYVKIAPRCIQATGRRLYRTYMTPVRAILSIAMVLSGLLAIEPDDAYMATGAHNTGLPTPRTTTRRSVLRGEILAEQRLEKNGQRSSPLIIELETGPEWHYGSVLRGNPSTGVQPSESSQPGLRKRETVMIDEIQSLDTNSIHPPTHIPQAPIIDHQDQLPELPKPDATHFPPEVKWESQETSKTTTAEPPIVTASITHVQANGQNLYPWGQCTWYAWSRRPDLPWFAGENGHARGWAISAQAYGLLVDSNPTVGAIAVFQPWVNGGHPVYGHVAYVEEVRENGLLLSECNMVYEALLPDYPRWWEGGGACGYRFISFDQLDSSVQFIH